MPLIDLKPFGSLGRELRKTAEQGWGTTARFAVLVAVLSVPLGLVAAIVTLVSR